MNVFDIATLARQAAVVAIKNNREGEAAKHFAAMPTQARRCFALSEIRRVVTKYGIRPPQDDMDRIYDEAVKEVLEER